MVNKFNTDGSNLTLKVLNHISTINVNFVFWKNYLCTRARDLLYFNLFSVENNDSYFSRYIKTTFTDKHMKFHITFIHYNDYPSPKKHKSTFRIWFCYIYLTHSIYLYNKYTNKNNVSSRVSFGSQTSSQGKTLVNFF